MSEQGNSSSNKYDTRKTKLEKVKEEALEQAKLNEETITNQEETRDERQAPSNIPKEWYQKNHPLAQVIGDLNEGIGTRRN